MADGRIAVGAALSEKLRILADAAKYDVACTSSGTARRGNGSGLGNCVAAGICHSFSGDGRCISLLKVLYTNECIYHCKYCVNRADNDIPRASFTPEELCRLLSEGPARVFGLWPERGRLAVGAAADVCVWDPSARWTISAATQHQAGDYTPWEGFEAPGRAHLVYVGGELVVRDGGPTGATPGRYVAR